MKILHISDLHLNQNYHKINFDKTKKTILSGIKFGFDHLVVSGDIAHDADEESFQLFRDLLKDFNLLDSSKTTVIIGNHDIFGGVYSVKDLINFPERCKITDYEKSLLRFVSYFEELFVDCYFPIKESVFPFSKIVGDFALIGINTNDVYSLLKNPFASNGRVSEIEHENIKKIFKQPEIEKKRKIILAHHHFYKNSYEAKSSSSEIWNKIEGHTLKLRGKKKLLKLFVKNNVEIVLHGHSHENKFYNRMGIDFYNAGGSIDNESENLATLNIIEISSKKTFYNTFNINIEENITVHY
jgi:3',5'-cyclic AMP phosphodiesterase CpdA